MRAMFKYGQINFKLIILEYTDSSKKSLLSTEQRYLDSGIFFYNTARIAGSTQGVYHTSESKAKMSINRMGINNPMYGKTLSQEIREKFSIARIDNTNAPSYKVSILDLDTGETILYDSIRKAAEAINSDIKSLWRLEKRKIRKHLTVIVILLKY